MALVCQAVLIGRWNDSQLRWNDWTALQQVWPTACDTSVAGVEPLIPPEATHREMVIKSFLLLPFKSIWISLITISTSCAASISRSASQKAALRSLPTLTELSVPAASVAFIGAEQFNNFAQWRGTAKQIDFRQVKRTCQNRIYVAAPKTKGELKEGASVKLDRKRKVTATGGVNVLESESGVEGN